MKVIMTKKYNFSSIRPQDMSPKIWSYSLCAVATVIWLFYGAFGFWLIGLSAHVSTGFVSVSLYNQVPESAASPCIFTDVLHLFSG